ncbi:MAG: hypothetical protein ACKOOI_07685, partial [Pirellula sp.]
AGAGGGAGGRAAAVHALPRLPGLGTGGKAGGSASILDASLVSSGILSGRFIQHCVPGLL